MCIQTPFHEILNMIDAVTSEIFNRTLGRVWFLSHVRSSEYVLVELKDWQDFLEEVQKNIEVAKRNHLQKIKDGFAHPESDGEYCKVIEKMIKSRSDKDKIKKALHLKTESNVQVLPSITPEEISFALKMVESYRALMMPVQAAGIFFYDVIDHELMSFMQERLLSPGGMPTNPYSNAVPAAQDFKERHLSPLTNDAYRVRGSDNPEPDPGSLSGLPSPEIRHMGSVVDGNHRLDAMAKLNMAMPEEGIRKLASRLIVLGSIWDEFSIDDDCTMIFSIRNPETDEPYTLGRDYKFYSAKSKSGPVFYLKRSDESRIEVGQQVVLQEEPVSEETIQAEGICFKLKPFESEESHKLNAFSFIFSEHDRTEWLEIPSDFFNGTTHHFSLRNKRTGECYVPQKDFHASVTRVSDDPGNEQILLSLRRSIDSTIPDLEIVTLQEEEYGSEQASIITTAPDLLAVNSRTDISSEEQEAFQSLFPADEDKPKYQITGLDFVEGEKSPVQVNVNNIAYTRNDWLKHLKENPIAFMEQCLAIKDADTGEVKPFNVNELQQKYYMNMIGERLIGPQASQIGQEGFDAALRACAAKAAFLEPHDGLKTAFELLSEQCSAYGFSMSGLNITPNMDGLQLSLLIPIDENYLKKGQE